MLLVCLMTLFNLLTWIITLILLRIQWANKNIEVPESCGVVCILYSLVIFIAGSILPPIIYALLLRTWFCSLWVVMLTGWPTLFFFQWRIQICTYTIRVTASIVTWVVSLRFTLGGYLESAGFGLWDIMEKPPAYRLCPNFNILDVLLAWHWSTGALIWCCVDAQNHGLLNSWWWLISRCV